MSTEARDTPKDALADALSDYFDVDIDEACEGLTDWLTDPSNRDVVLAAMGGVRSEVVVSEIPLKVWTFPEGREAVRPRIGICVIDCLACDGTGRNEETT